MPVTANIQFSYLPSPYFRGKQYYGLGIGYYMTDLQTEFKQSLTALGYHVFYGMEMPSGDRNAFFFEFGYHSADLSRYLDDWIESVLHRRCRTQRGHLEAGRIPVAV